MNRPLRWSWITGPFLIMISPFIFLFICLVLAGYVVHEIGRSRDWVQVMDVCRWRSGDKVTGEYYFLRGMGSTMQSNKLYVQWANGEKELLTTRTFDSKRSSCSCSTNGDLNAIAVGVDLFYRTKSSTPGQWDTWRLVATQNIYDFIKQYLDDHYTNSYEPFTSELWPPGSFKIKCTPPDEEQTLPIVTRGDLPYSIKEILNGGHDLVVVPDFASRYAPVLIFSQNKEIPGWHLNKRETLRRNKDRKN